MGRAGGAGEFPPRGSGPAIGVTFSVVLIFAQFGISPRREGPFVKLNCAALPPELLESELFGHEKGAFTGAYRRELGKFEFAHKGTLFLDEIGELPLALQPKLLHVLQDMRFSRIGGRDLIDVDVREMASTNRDLELALSRGHLREDFYSPSPCSDPTRSARRSTRST